MKQLKIVCATNQPELDKELSCDELEVVDEVYFREAVLQAVEQHSPEVVVLSVCLPGSMDLKELIYRCRVNNTRIIFLAGHLNPKDELILSAFNMGVYDILFNPVSSKHIKDSIVNPATFGDVANILGINLEKQDIVASDDFEEEGEGNEQHVSPEGERSNLLCKMVRKVSKTIDKKIKVLDNVIAVWSPVSSGKTFVAVNLAAALAETGSNVTLIDFDVESFAVHTFLGLGAGEAGLLEALLSLKDKSTDLLSCCCCPRNVPGLLALTSDPREDISDTFNFKNANAAQLLEILAEESELVLIDTARDYKNSLTMTAVSKAGQVWVVADPDRHHLIFLEKTLDEIQQQGFDLEKWQIVVNRLVDEENIKEIEGITGLPVRFYIPDNSAEVFKSISQGIPAVALLPT